ncbi:MAG: hypothetical protein C4576_31215 [Desulfobacteraceae bacterium]|nr:MAG: hypothetical protein C4576_31215 [Desulfobacteraceae bacterium]
MAGILRKAGIMIIGAGALGLLAAGVVGCGPRTPFEGRDHAWSFRRGPHGFHKGDFEAALKHVDERVEALNLTEAQKEKYAAIRLKIKSELIQGRENRKKLAVDVRNEMQRDLPDMHKVAGMVSDHIGMLPAALDKGMNLFLEFYEVLDENQKTKIIKHMRKHLDRIPFKDPTEKSDASGIGDPVTGLGSLSEQMAQKRSDWHGELL